MRRRLAAGAVVVAACCACGAQAGSLSGSVLALPALGAGDVPELVVMQRAITREWGPSDDSTYTVIEVPDYKSEGWAAVMSAVVPGAGQAYVGEKSAFFFALAEVVGWTTRAVFGSKSDDSEASAGAIAGAPTDTASAWSASRWQAATGGDPSRILELYGGDRSAYYEALANDPTYTAGWRGGGDPSQQQFKSSYDESQDYEHKQHVAEAFLWLNHAVAAFDALRAARIHNLPLQQNLDIQLKSSWRGGKPSLRAALERHF